MVGPIDPFAVLQDPPARSPGQHHESGTQGANKRSGRCSHNVCALCIAIFASKRMSNHDLSYHAQFYIGVDGGGTSCRARIEDAEGRLLGQGAAGPAATRFGADRSMQAVRTASLAAATDAGLPPTALANTSAGVGLAGIDRKGAGEALRNSHTPFRKIA